MKKLLVLSCALLTLFACKKSDDTRSATVYGKGIEDMGLAYNHTYLFYFNRTIGGVTTVDSDRVLFRSNGTVSEVANVYDILSHTYPDTLTFAVNTSFDNGITWNQIPNAQVFSFYPVHDSTRGYLLHDYLNSGVVSIFKVKGDNTSNIQLRVVHASSDSASYVDGYLKKL